MDSHSHRQAHLHQDLLGHGSFDVAPQVDSRFVERLQGRLWRIIGRKTDACRSRQLQRQIRRRHPASRPRQEWSGGQHGDRHESNDPGHIRPSLHPAPCTPWTCLLMAGNRTRPEMDPCDNNPCHDRVQYSAEPCEPHNRRFSESVVRQELTTNHRFEHEGAVDPDESDRQRPRDLPLSVPAGAVTVVAVDALSPRPVCEIRPVSLIEARSVFQRLLVDIENEFVLGR